MVSVAQDDPGGDVDAKQTDVCISAISVSLGLCHPFSVPAERSARPRVAHAYRAIRQLTPTELELDPVERRPS